jgi:hypothetical protein
MATRKKKVGRRAASKQVGKKKATRKSMVTRRPAKKTAKRGLKAGATRSAGTRIVRLPQ